MHTGRVTQRGGGIAVCNGPVEGKQTLERHGTERLTSERDAGRGMPGPEAAQLTRVLIVEDNPDDAFLVKESLSEANGQFKWEHAETADDARRLLDRRSFDVVLLDLGLADSQGLATLALIRLKARDVPILVLTGHADDTIALTAVRAGAQDYLVKGEVEGGTLARALRYAVERKRAEDALRKSERRYRNIVETALDGFWIADMDGRILDVNDSYCQMTGYTREELLSMTMSDVEVLEKPEDAIRHTGTLIAKGRERLETRHRCKDGTVLDIEISATCSDIDGGRFVVFGRDITERKRAEVRLLAYQQQLRGLASMLSLAEERERRHVVTWLHDSFAQALALAKMKLAALREKATSADIEEHVDDIQTILDQVIQQTRSLTYELAPPVLYLIGLEEAVKQLAQEFQEKYTIPCSVEDDARPKPLEDAMRATLYRDVRELLANVVKHAHASMVQVGIRKVGDTIHIQVRDDGVGFDASWLGVGTGGGDGFGLFSIRERIGHLGGELRIESGPGQGTKATLVAPLSRSSGS